MKIDSDLVRKLRSTKSWTQEQLGEASDLDPRTIQRIESTGKASPDSINRLATALEVDPADLVVIENNAPMAPGEAIRSGLANFADFSGTAGRAEYWWFLVFVLLVCAIATVIDQRAGGVAILLLLVPLLAAGTRRLRDAGQSGWWQLLFFVPFGFVPVFFILAMESAEDDDAKPAKASLDTA